MNARDFLRPFCWLGFHIDVPANPAMGHNWHGDYCSICGRSVEFGNERERYLARRLRFAVFRERALLNRLNTEVVTGPAARLQVAGFHARRERYLTLIKPEEEKNG